MITGECSFRYLDNFCPVIYLAIESCYNPLSLQFLHLFHSKISVSGEEFLSTLIVAPCLYLQVQSFRLGELVRIFVIFNTYKKYYISKKKSIDMAIVSI